ncbi:hypothetical protein [Pseudodesulfovibrio sp.]|uniref:hypothetical protein n=1 Tax=Pseudodesulfovibrio sp. TaxID=2035812 RepID=UPI00262415B3|nr:hypothetical protein [Pseudodesulfovibrio sp.]MDD3311406.1 hypothetical protein [Pseudodesulfovibrio sp.]
MENTLWDRFIERLNEAGKLDEFCALHDTDIDAWLEAHHMGVTVDQLAAAAPKVKLSDDDLDNLSGGRIVLHAIDGSRPGGPRRPIF